MAKPRQRDPVQVRTLLCGMRMFDRVGEGRRPRGGLPDAGVVGFDIRVPRTASRPPTTSAPSSICAARASRSPSTAGERRSAHIHQALQVCGRPAHRPRRPYPEDIVDGKLGRLAGWVRDRRIALEMCPTSNLQTGAATSIAEHPITALKDLGFRVTLNTDNRLVSGTTMNARDVPPGDRRRDGRGTCAPSR